LVDVLVQIERRQDQDAWRVYALEQPPGGLDPVQPRHAHVEDDDVWLERARLRECLVAVFGLAHDLDVVFAFEDHADAAANERLVVDDEDADHDVPPSCGSCAVTKKPPVGLRPVASVPP